MKGKFPNGLAAAMARKGVGPTELGRLSGYAKQDIARWKDGERRLQPEIAAVLAPLLETTPDALLYPAGGQELPSPHRAQPAWAPPPSPDEIPLYGQILGGRLDAVPFDDEAAGTISRPPALSGVRGAYAAYVVGDSMEPRYRAGEVVYINPRQPPKRNDYVAVQLHPEEGGPVLLYVKKLISGWPASVIKLEQHNPKRVLEYPAKRVKQVHRVVMSGEG